MSNRLSFDDFFHILVQRTIMEFQVILLSHCIESQFQAHNSLTKNLKPVGLGSDSIVGERTSHIWPLNVSTKDLCLWWPHSRTTWYGINSISNQNFAEVFMSFIVIKLAVLLAVL